MPTESWRVEICPASLLRVFKLFSILSKNIFKTKSDSPNTFQLRCSMKQSPEDENFQKYPNGQ